jgi:hypothetical protein
LNKHLFHQSASANRLGRNGAIVIWIWLALWNSLPAQEAFRISLAGQQAAEQRKLALEQEKLNIKLGPVGLRFTGGLTVNATDNVFAREDDERADLFVRPAVSLFSLWRLSERNALTFGMGLGYTKYVKTTQYDSLFISPDTDLSLDVYAGDFVINFHDRFSYSQDVSSDPTISGTGSLNRFENMIGTAVTWDLNKVVLTAGYDHTDFIATESEFEHLTHTADLFTAAARFIVTPTFAAGLEIGGGRLDYNEEVLQDNQHIAAGPFVMAQLSEYTQVRLAGGYVTYDLARYANTYSEVITTNVVEGMEVYTTNLVSSLPSHNDAFYFNGSVRSRLGSLLVHTLTFGRVVQSGIASDLVDLWYVRSSGSWNLFRKTSLTTSLSYEHATTSKTAGETLDRYGFGFTLSRPLTRRVTGSAGYQFFFKNSDLAGSDYLQNRLVLNVVYTF